MVFETHIDPLQLLQWQDWLAFAATVVLTVLAVYWGQKFRKKQELSQKLSALDYLIMGRQLTLPLFVPTLVATWYGGVLGVTQIAFEQGIYNFVTQGMFWYISYLLFALLMVRRIRTFNAITLPQLINRLFGPKSARFAVFLLFTKVLPITYVMSLGFLLQFLFGIPYKLATAIGLGFVVLYSLWGGFRAVVFSDLVQFIAMCAGIACVVVCSVVQFGGYAFLQSNLPASYFTMTGQMSWSQTLVWLFIAGSTTFLNPAFYQRCFAAVDDRVATRGILLAIIVWMAIDICTTLGGMYARAVVPEADSGQAYLIYSFQILPIGLKGLFLGALLAMILSTLDSFLFIASATLSFDVGRLWMRKQNLSHRTTLLLTAALTLVVVWYFGGHFESSWRFFKSCFSACLLCPLLYGYFFPDKASDDQFVFASFSAFGVMLIWGLTPLGQWFEVDAFYVGVIVNLGAMLFYRKRSKATLEFGE